MVVVMPQATTAQTSLDNKHVGKLIPQVKTGFLNNPTHIFVHSIESVTWYYITWHGYMFSTDYITASRVVA